MAQTGFTPIQLYSTSTVAAVPVAGNLTNSTLGSELAINITDGKLFYKDNANAVQVIANKLWIGTVTSVSGTSPVAVATGTSTPVISLSAGYGDTQNPYASKTANNFLAAPNGSPGVPTFRAIVAADIPTLNQNTTGSAATLTTARNLWGQSFNGSADISAPLYPAVGSVSLPAYSASGDTNTGIFFPAADTIAFTEGGVEAMRIDSTADVLIGTTAAIPGAFSDRGKLQIAVNTGEAVQQNFAFLNNSSGSIIYLNKSRSGTIGTNTIVQNGDTLGALVFAGADGTAYHRAADITVSVDGVPGANDMPGRITFSTTPDGFTNPTSRMAITAAGDVNIVTGNVVIATSGKGIDFSATPGTGTSELLADYEEGTWTPTITALAGSITTVSATGTYTKVGRQVTAAAVITITINGTGAGAVYATLPFGTPATSYAGFGREAGVLFATMNIVTLQSDNRMQITSYNNAYPGGSGSTIVATAVYFV